MEAVISAVTFMEGKAFFAYFLRFHPIHADCPLFNAGKGAVFNIDGKVSFNFTSATSPFQHP